MCIGYVHRVLMQGHMHGAARVYSVLKNCDVLKHCLGLASGFWVWCYQTKTCVPLATPECIVGSIVYEGLAPWQKGRKMKNRATAHLLYILFAKLQDLGNTQVYNGDPVRGTSELLLSSKCIAVPSLRRLFGLGEPLVPFRGGWC